jgi:hypothetical protein
MSWGVPKIGTVAEVASGNLTLTEPAGVAQGDLLIACIAIRSTVGFANADWTKIEGQLTGNTVSTGAGIASGEMWYCVRNSVAPSLVFTRTGGDLGRGCIIAYAGGKQTLADVLSVHSSNTLGAASVTATTGTITTVEANELIVAMIAQGDNYTASAFDAATDPTTASGATDTTNAPTAGTWRERVDGGTNTGADGGLAIADAIRATAGATGTIQVTSSGSARHVMIASAFRMLIDTTIAAGVGALTLAGFAPTVTTTNNIIAGAALGVALLTGFAPTVVTTQSTTPDVGVLTLTGYAPSVTLGVRASPGVGGLTATGFAPTVVGGKILPVNATPSGVIVSPGLTRNITIPAPADGNTLVCVFSHITAANGITSITQTGATWDPADDHTTGRNVSIWVAKNVYGASTSVTLNFNTSLVGAIGFSILEFSGIHPSAIIEAVASTNGSSTTIDAGTSTPTAGREALLVEVMRSAGTPSAGPTNGFTGGQSDATGGGNAAWYAYRVAAPTSGGYSTSWTQTSGTWAASIVSITNPDPDAAVFEERLGFNVPAYEAHGNSARTGLKYWTFKPSVAALAAKGLVGSPYPVAIVFPGSSEKGLENTKQMRGGGGAGDSGNLAQKLGWSTANNGTPSATFPFYTIFLEVPDDIADATEERQFTKAMIDAVIADIQARGVPIDPTKIGATGYSYGGIIVLHYAYARPTTLAWVFPMAGCPAEAELSALPGVVVSPLTNAQAAVLLARQLLQHPIRYWVSSSDPTIGTALWQPLVTEMNNLGAGWTEGLGAGDEYRDTGTDHGGVWNDGNTKLTTSGSVQETWALAQVRSQNPIIPGWGVLTATGYAPTVSIGSGAAPAPGVGALTATGFAPSVLVRSTTILWKDVFTGTTGNPSLNTHEPTIIGMGVTQGTWQGSAGTATITSATNTLTEGNGSSGNRRYTQNLGEDEYDVEMDFTPSSTANVFTGIIVRSANGSSGGYEFSRDITGGGWTVSEAGVGSLGTYASPSPTTPQTIRAEVRDAYVKLYAGSTLVHTITTPKNNGTGNYCGVIPGSFAGGTGRNAITRFEVTRPPVNAGVGALSLTGFAPTVSVAAATGPSPGTGVLTATGFAPSIAVSNHQTVNAGVGALTATGFAPVAAVSNNIAVAPALGVVTATGFAPSASASNAQGASPGTGLLSATGAAPTVTASNHQIVAVGTGAATLTGFAPVVTVSNHQIVAAGTGALTATGFSPSIVVGNAIVVQAGVGALTATGFLPTVQLSANVRALAGVGALTATGFAPTLALSDHRVVEPDTGTITVAGFAPTVIASDARIVAPGTGMLGLVGFAPLVSGISLDLLLSDTALVIDAGATALRADAGAFSIVADAGVTVLSVDSGVTGLTPD